MPEKSFHHLVQILGPILQDDIIKACNWCSEEIYPEIFVAIGLCYLTCGSYDDIRKVYGVSVLGFFYHRNRFFKVVMNYDALKIHSQKCPANGKSSDQNYIVRAKRESSMNVWAQLMDFYSQQNAQQ
jgi:hypothetical protein